MMQAESAMPSAQNLVLLSQVKTFVCPYFVERFLSALENYAFFGGLSNVCTQML